LALTTIAAFLNSRVHTIATIFVCLFVLAALPAMHDVDHLHFEIRDAPTDDPYNHWQRDAIHSLTVLPHADASCRPYFRAVNGNDPDPLGYHADHHASPAKAPSSRSMTAMAAAAVVREAVAKAIQKRIL